MQQPLSAAEFERLQQEGWLLAAGIVPDDAAAAMYEMVSSTFDEWMADESDSVEHEGSANGGRETYRCYGLLQRARSFGKLLQHAAIDATARKHFKGDYRLTGYTAYVVMPGSKEGSWHTDGCTRSAQAQWERSHGQQVPLVLNALVYLDAVSVEHGATRFVPRLSVNESERDELRGGVCDAPSCAALFSAEDVRQAPGPRGSVLFMDGAMWHSSGKYRTSGPTEARPRIVLVLAFTSAKIPGCYAHLQQKWVGPTFDGRDVTDDGFRGAYWVDDDAAAPARGAATSAQDAASSDAMFVVSSS